MPSTLNALHTHVGRVDLDSAGMPGLCAWRVDNRVGESPTWNDATGELLWIDVRAPSVLRLNPHTSIVARWQLPEVVGALGLSDGDTVVLALRRSLASLDLATGRLETLLEIDSEPPGNRLNDGKVSPSGRWFVFGSMDDRPAGKQPSGSLYCVGADLGLRRLHSGLTVANGIAWYPDGATLYFSDSHAGKVWQAAWNDAEGTMTEPRLFCRADEETGRPDGAAVDATGHYWSAGVSAGCLNRFAPDGRHVQRLSLPCRGPTMPCFGGERLDLLFVTSLVRPGWAVDDSNLDGALIGVPGVGRGVPASRWAVTPDRRTT